MKTVLDLVDSDETTSRIGNVDYEPEKLVDPAAKQTERRDLTISLDYKVVAHARWKELNVRYSLIKKLQCLHD